MTPISRSCSMARGMPEVCTTRALVLNPPGTTHRDCFRGLDGRFFTLSIPLLHGARRPGIGRWRRRRCVCPRAHWFWPRGRHGAAAGADHRINFDLDAELVRIEGRLTVDDVKTALARGGVRVASVVDAAFRHARHEVLAF